MAGEAEGQTITIHTAKQVEPNLHFGRKIDWLGQTTTDEELKGII